MPGEDIQSWSTTAAANANADTAINWAEGQPRASVNNSARSQMAAHAKQRNLLNGSITTTGSANAQAFTSGVGYTAVPTGLTVRLKIGATNTGATTLNMDGIGAVAIKDQAGQDIGANVLMLGRYVDLIYNGTNWIILSASVAAAPFDALAYNGMQVNGSMEVSQELGTGGITTPGYVCDGWYVSKNGTMVFGALHFKQVLFPGLNWFLNVGITTAQPALGTTDSVYITQNIEGWRVARLAWGTPNAQPITIGFWTCHTRGGLYSGSIRSSDAARSYAFTYTASAGTVEYHTVTIPGDTSGTWNTDNTIGMTVFFAMAGGSAAVAPSANAWLSGSYIGAPGQINGVAATSDVFRITGVIILPGSDAPSAARSPFIMRSFDQELELCKRYYFSTYNYGVAAGTPTGGGGGRVYLGGGAPAPYSSGSLSFPTSLRASPSIITYDNAGTPGCTSYFTGTWNNNGVVNIGALTTNAIGFFAQTSGVATLFSFDFIADVRL